MSTDSGPRGVEPESRGGVEPEPTGSVEPQEWRRMHPITPAIKGWKVLVGVLVIASYQFGDDLRRAIELVEGGGWRIVLGVITAVVVVGFGYSALAWRMTRYAVTDEAVHLQQGVLFRQQRQARLDRLQAVDVVQPLLARLTGLAELRLEVAGGSGSAVSLAFLREPEAEAVRAELLARAAGVRRAESEVQAPAAPEQPLFEVPMGRLVAATLRSAATVGLVVVVIAMIVIAVVSRDLGPAFVLVPGLLGFVGFFWTRFNRGANFRAAISPDGIRLRHGLTEARAQTVPPGRVQALSITQGPLWRGPDWWRVEMNVAGYGGSSDSDHATENVLLPVGTRDEAVLALWLVLPDLGVPDPRAVVEAGLSGAGGDVGYTTMPRRGRWLDLLAWRRRGVLVTDRALLIRSGRFVRRLVVVPHERTQSLALQQGPIQRRLRVASMVVHSTPGPVSPTVDHLDEHVAARLLAEQADRARTARKVATPEQWMRRPEDA
ncbi:PH domain-containing protein [Cellulomonas cellasea]|uniref:PH domain-containing protein n=1 Tax=Cellulomonas cellasea TaxID=43670 RepID=UPI00338DD321